MADGYSIKIGVDSRAASRGVKSFTSDLNASLKALREFDSRAKSAFKALDQFSKINSSGLSRAMKGISGAIADLNRIKINRSLVNNLQALQKALSGIRFSGGNSLKKLPGALKALESIRVNPAIVSTLNQIKSALKGFSGPPKSLAGWTTAFNGLSAIKIPSNLAQKVEALKSAVRGFVGPAKSAWNLPNLLRQIGRNNIPATLAANIAALKAALAGFHGPSAKAGTNLAALIHAMQAANPQQIAAVAAALQRLNGLNINIGRTLASIGSSGTRGFGALRNSLHSASQSMRTFYQQTNMARHATGLLSTTLGGLSLGTIVKGIYDTGNSYIALQRSLGAVATSAEEVRGHLQFINDLTEIMPVSLEAAHKAYAKFAVAARLSGMSAKDTQEIFESFSMGFAAMGMSGDSQKFAFLALEQMISKGTIQMEELRRQLGDHLPGAVQILADSMDVPVSKLIKMVENGEVSADRLIGMAKRIREQFEAAAGAAQNSSQGQIIALQNAWVKFKRIVFGSDFNAALGAMAKSLAGILNAEDMQAFGKKVGEAFGRAFRAVSVFAQVLAENKDVVVSFLKGFALYSIVIATAQALRMLAIPLAVIGPVLGVAGAALTTFGAGLRLLVTGQIVSAAAKFFSGMTVRLLAFAAVVIGLAAAFDYLLTKFDAIAGTSMGGNFDKLIGGLKTAFTSLAGQLGELDPFKGIDESLKKAMGSFDADMDAIANQNLIFEDQMEKRKKAEEALLEAKNKALSKEAEDLWKLINPIAHANEEYQKQLVLLDEIAKKKGLTGDQKGALKSVLDAKTLGDRDPMGAQIRDYRLELSAASAKTAEQEAMNEALVVQNEMLEKGIVLTKGQVDAIADYHKGIAKMNGDLGNGIERWTASVGDFNDNLQEAIKDGIEGLSDEITNFVTGAEADFAGLARSILRSFVKMSLDSLLKDMFGAMGMDGQKNGQNMAEQALAKLAGMGENITTAQTNVYTSGLSINGVPLTGGAAQGAPGTFGASPELGPNNDAKKVAAAVSDKIIRQPLPDIPGTDVASPYDLEWDERVAKNMEKASKATMSMAEQYGSYGAGKLVMQRQGLAVSSRDSMLAAKQAQTDYFGPVSPYAGDQPYSTSVVPGLRGGFGVGGAPAAASSASFARNLSLSEQDITDIAKVAQTEVVSSLKGDNYTMQTRGVVDTIMNRRMSGQFGGSIRDVVNAKGQFSKINGPQGYTDQNGRFHNLNPYGAVENMPDSHLSGRMRSEVETYLQQRAQGMESSVGGNVNYLNPRYSGKSAMRSWGNDVVSQAEQSGQIYGAGGAKHYHGTAPGYRQADPYGVQVPGQSAGLDPMTTQGITQLNQKIASVGQAATTAAPQVDQMKTKMTETGTTATTAGQQTQMANQTKSMSEQTAAMQTQMAGQNIQMAGTNAATAGPQFTQAGTAMQQAGIAAQSAGQSAGAVQPQMSGFGQGISGLLGPLASAIPGLGQFGGMIMQLLQSLMGGGGGIGSLLGGLFSEGGMSTSPVSSVKLPSSVWANAPHFADGVANTSGGMPAVLHPNEAVIPLTKGRKVPVEMDQSREPRQEKLDRQAPTMVFNLNGVKDADSFKRSKSQIQTAMASTHARSQMRNG